MEYSGPLFEKLMAFRKKHPLFDKFCWNIEYKLGNWGFIDNIKPDFRTTIIDEFLKGGGLLDLGCGTGSLCTALDSYSHYTGVDLSAVAIAKAKKRYTKLNNVNFMCDNIVTLENEETYDVILFMEIIYYIPQDQWDLLFSNYRKKLSKDGVFIAFFWKMDFLGCEAFPEFIKRFEMVDFREINGEFCYIFR